MDLNELNLRIKEYPRPVILYFWAPWCAPCRVMKPALKKIEQEYVGSVDLWEINADQQAKLLQDLNIRGIPTLIAYRSEGEIARLTGIQSAQNVRSLFDAALSGLVPVVAGIAPFERILRLTIAAALFGLGLSNGSSFWLMLASGIIAFSAVYDRCPIWRATYPRLQALLKRMTG